MIPPLPTEILHHIIKLSLPAVSFGTYRQRYDLLIADSLVNSTWRALARKELYKELFARDLDHAAAALEAEGACAMAKRGHLGGDRGRTASDELDDPDLYESDLPATLKEMRIACLRLHMPDMHSLSQLQTLHLRWFDFGYSEGLERPTSISPSPPTFLFASLTTLSLLDAYLFPHSFPTWTDWFTTTHFPLLRRLSIGFTDDLEELGEEDDFNRALASLAAQITHFSLAQGGSELGTDHDFPWAKFTGLQELVLFPRSWQSITLLRATLESVPSFLSALRVHDGRSPDLPHHGEEPWQTDALGAISDAFVKAAPSVQKLTVLSVDWAEEEASEALDENAERLHQAMETRGGSFQYRMRWEGQDELLDWERLFEPW